MTDLELIFKAEKEKHDINKKTAEDLNKKIFQGKKIFLLNTDTKIIFNMQENKQNNYLFIYTLFIFYIY